MRNILSAARAEEARQAQVGAAPVSTPPRERSAEPATIRSSSACGCRFRSPRRHVGAQRPDWRRRHADRALHPFLAVDAQVAPAAGVRRLEHRRRDHQAGQQERHAGSSIRACRLSADRQLALRRHGLRSRAHRQAGGSALGRRETSAARANDDSFCYTNATPQHEKFNRLAPALWKSLEDEIFAQVDVADLRIALVGGPILAADDRPFCRRAPRGDRAGADSAAVLQDRRLPRQRRRPREGAGVPAVAGVAARARADRPAGLVEVQDVPGGRDARSRR